MKKKTTLEMFKEIQDLDMPDGVGITVKDIVPFMCEKVEQALNRLESLDNANPSEALECLEKLLNGYSKGMAGRSYYDTIKQALLKAQEPKKYLKWEDLEFKKEEQTMKVILNGSKYKLSYFTDGILEYVDLITNNEKFLIGKYVCDYEKQFFNDLHLERVEE